MLYWCRSIWRMICMSKEIIQTLKDRVRDVNNEQSSIREKKGNVFTDCVAHTPHVEQQDFSA